MRVLLLGGTGLISREIVRKLLVAGHDVTVYNRGKRFDVGQSDVEQIIGDRFDVQKFQQQMAAVQCDVVIDMIAFTEEDAKNTIRAFRDRARQIIICSSVAAYKRPYRSIPTKESRETPFDSPEFPYAFQKAEMERYIQRVSTDEGVHTTIIRPSLTYGIGGMNVGVLRQNANIVDRIRKGKPLVMFGDGTTPWNFTFADDLADAFVGAVGNEATYGKAYHATNGVLHYWNDLYQAFGRVVGIEPNIVHLPTDILYAASPELFGHLFYEKMYAGHFDNAKIRADVSTFDPKVDLDSGLRRLLDWYDSGDGPDIDDAKDVLEDKLAALHSDMTKQARKLFD